MSGRLIVDELAAARPGMRIGWAPALDTPPKSSRAGRGPGTRSSRSAPATSTAPRRSCWSGSREIEEGVELSRYTTLGTGGPAHAFARPETPEEVAELLHWAPPRGLAVAVVGLGSNLLAADVGVDALVLKLGGELARVEVDGDVIRAGAGATNAVCLHRARDAGLGGFEFACAIPARSGAASG